MDSDARGAVKILVTGRGTSGSWQVRGEQLGRAIGATVLPRATEFDAFDAVILVKRPTPEQRAAIRRSQVPVVWDVVDAYPQPQGNDWPRAECLSWLRQEMAEIQPAAVVAATRAMSADLEGFGVPVLTLPHHARPGLRFHEPGPLRTVGYEGGIGYIRHWIPIIDAECKRRGLAFYVNPKQLADLDVVLAVRDATGYAPRNWKSNVKLANAQGSGTPVICCREAGYTETSTGGELWADNATELRLALDMLADHGRRHEIGRVLYEGRITLEAVAEIYRGWLCKTVLRSLSATA
jgi:hypothetical protein